MSLASLSNDQNYQRRLTGSSSVQFHLISLHFSSAVPCRHAHTPKLCQSHYRSFQWPDCSCRDQPIEPQRTNCSEVEPKFAGHFPALNFISLYLSHLPIPPLPRASALSAHSLLQIKTHMLPYFHLQAGSSSAHPRHTVIRVCLNLSSAPVEELKPPVCCRLATRLRIKLDRKLSQSKGRKKVGQKTDVCLTVMKKKRHNSHFKCNF